MSIRQQLFNQDSTDTSENTSANRKPMCTFSEPSVMSTFSDLKIGFVGLGNNARTHARIIDGHGADIVAGTDIVGSARDSFSQEYDAAVYADFEEMYRAESLDGVIVSTPNKFHEPGSTAALERNIPVLCEKPLAHSAAAAERMAAADAASDAFLMVGFNGRFCAAASLFTGYDEEHGFGHIEHIEANYIRRRGVPGVGSWFTNKEISGGGALIDVGVHIIDFSLYLAGYPQPTEILGVARDNFVTAADYVDPDNRAKKRDTSAGETNVDDSVSAFIRCENGTTISLEVAWATNREPNRDIIVRGTDAGAKMTFGGDSLQIYGAGGAGIDHYDDRQLTGTMEPNKKHAQDKLFLEGVLHDERPSMNRVEDGVTVQQVVEAIYESSETGGTAGLGVRDSASQQEVTVIDGTPEA